MNQQSQRLTVIIIIVSAVLGEANPVAFFFQLCADPKSLYTFLSDTSPT